MAFESSIDFTAFISIIKHAQICSSILKQLSSAQAFHQSAEKAISTVSKLGRRLEQWRESLPKSLQPGIPINSCNIDLSSKNHIAFLHYLYYGSLISLHGNFAYPWICDTFDAKRSQVFIDQIARSTSIVAEASRNIILLSRHVEVDITFPTW